MPPSADLLHQIEVQQEEEKEETRREAVDRLKNKLSDIEDLPTELELVRWIEATNVSVMQSEQEGGNGCICREISRCRSLC